ncbi:uncharacterized protein HMPREF1541_07208 [Cyphellophora europaea CBS 101466]|uniref:Non-homologous end-joining factor 1 n=1 Tax=Cyphellophora europaea (strain CBS 101466) TaxID=1220924 RepID=W2RM42_CYPE1|nr:uncharacterized protein HMPREF1541_07208 [Cyphellophora europaea CBS 101466]ETN37586.1 hypothetical protein HMPREF1541_07208 [Cyphellophora europaea CBS 101466]
MAGSPPPSTSPWKPLQRSRRPQLSLPPLHHKLITTTDKSARLTLHVTDLTTLYTATLSHSAITAEATRSHSPIDPAESAKQFTVLLTYLSQSLAGQGNTLARSDDDDDDEETANLALRTSIALPKPLPPLTFTFRLTRQSPAAFSGIVLRPALHATQVLRGKLQKLLEVVRDKDHVIARLLERVGSQASGDMSLVFPTLTGRKGRGGEKVGVEEAGRWVPGLREFDGEEWEGEEGEGDGVDGLVLQGAAEGNVESEDWVGRLPGLEALEDGGKEKAGLSRQVTKETTMAPQMEQSDEDATDSEDEFERQPTPPSARKGGRTTASPQATTKEKRPTKSPETSSDDSDAPPAKKQKTSAADGKRGTKLGGLGRNKTGASVTPAQDSSSPEPEAQHRRRQPSTSPASEGRRASNASTATATESDDEPQPLWPTTRSNARDQHQSSFPPASSPPATRATSKPPRLGGLKGKPKPKPADSATSTPSPEPVSPVKRSESVSTTPLARKGKLGRLGVGRRTRTPSVEPEATRNSPAQPASETPTHRLGKLGMRRKGMGRGATPEMETVEETEGGHGSRQSLSEEEEDLDQGSTANQRHSARQSGTAAAELHRDTQHRPITEEAKSQHNGRKGQDTEQEDEVSRDREPETAEQAAARRRAELKSTAAKAPAKKKRRF